ncbi:Galactokinase [Fistulina hepatica ATCC 64428]|nr:Galactokinase [Fistulina hepatica ATCC 64428]
MAAQEIIPVLTKLSDVYSRLGATQNAPERWTNLADEFQRRFGQKPKWIARAPGRVNIIGEHIDYALFGVFPMAIEADILMACAPRASGHPGSVDAQNLSAQYPNAFFAPIDSGSDAQVHKWVLDIDTKELHWESYVKAGYYGVLNNYLSSKSGALPVPVDLLVTGTVPSGSGLSSSAAMGVASTLTFLAANGHVSERHANRLSKGDLVRMTMSNEQLVGVNSGGMDQAASVISYPGSALYITFYPQLEAIPTPLPRGAVFVIANSLVVSDKAVTAKWHYNLRVVETLVGARVLAHKLGLAKTLDGPDGRKKFTLRELLGAYAGEVKDHPLNDAQLKDACERILNHLNLLLPKGHVRGGEEGVTMAEMISMTGLSDADFHKLYLSWVEVEAERFQLYKRAKHVFSEALRVLAFRATCSGAHTDATLPELARLMNESQESCARVFECSCPELDALVALARQHGAIGSRLTGAGWGGATVSLVPENKVDEFIKQLKARYPRYQGLSEEALADAVLMTKPSSGAFGEFERAP